MTICFLPDKFFNKKHVKVILAAALQFYALRRRSFLNKAIKQTTTALIIMNFFISAFNRILEILLFIEKLD